MSTEVNMPTEKKSDSSVNLLKINAKGPKLAAEGGVSEGKTGAEIKASLVELDAKAGPVTATVGLNANTGASIGADRTGFKVLGTGGYVGREGIEISLFGSGFKIGF